MNHNYTLRGGAAAPLLFLLTSFGLSPFVRAATTRYEAENCQLANATTATAGGGYSGAGYVTGLTSEWSKVFFERGYDGATPLTLAIRYANPLGTAVTNIALYRGSNRVQGLTFAPTAAGSRVVDRGLDVGLPYAGAAPDLGRWEWGGAGPLAAGGAALGARPAANLAADDLSAAPNPTSTGRLRVTTRPEVKITQIQVLDVWGRPVLSVPGSRSHTADLDLSACPNAVYLLRVRHATGVITRRIILAQ